MFFVSGLRIFWVGVVRVWKVMGGEKDFVVLFSWFRVLNLIGSGCFFSDLWDGFFRTFVVVGRVFVFKDLV